MSGAGKRASLLGRNLMRSKKKFYDIDNRS
jgi:hypothetical protein